MIDWWGPILQEYYAATQAIGITMVDSPTWLTKPGSVGRSMLGIVHICDELGSELPWGKTGLVYLNATCLRRTRETTDGSEPRGLRGYWRS